jgi:hypothetical protein
MTRSQFIKHINTDDFGRINDSTLMKALCGQYKDHGSSRDVYQCKMHHDFVVKVQYNGKFDNVLEHEIWGAIQYADWWAEWFAECVFISKTGKILIQQKIILKPSKKDYPKKIPRFFTDIKIDNYGFVGDQLKCCDYAHVLGMLTGCMDKKMRRATW